MTAQNVATTLTLSGSGFDDSTTVSLVSSGGTTYSASSVQEDLPTQLTATFAANSLPAGTYTIAVTKDGQTVDLPTALVVNPAAEAAISSWLSVPAGVGYHLPLTLYLNVTNVGNVPVPAPVFVVSAYQQQNWKLQPIGDGGYIWVPDGPPSIGALMSLDPSKQGEAFFTSAVPAGFSHSVEILASGSTPGWLEPDEQVRIPIYYAGWQVAVRLRLPSDQLLLWRRHGYYGGGR